ncbi:Alkaline phosphatase [Venustampulla echinocandica]|uniref:Alkaline phosphatase n=1 Tax=Venustampulla echinocandica TaxID=2656787 RepID=A0A370TVX6_9HELO|nr:Alkaline phosphatase [Venustampulla echinocandica]RDL39687.1 Alkaline phosphatase [Venustampulla echinocandica]
MSSNQPLFASERRDSSTHSEERAAQEDTALLGGQRPDESPPRRSAKFWREVGLFTWAVLATAAVLVLAVVLHNQAAHHGGKKAKPSGKRNLIFMVSDGMGPASLSLSRSFRQYQSVLPRDDILVLDQHFIGSSRTRSTSSLVTDSAAGATAFSCGLKSYNGAISVLPDYTPCGTVLEAAKKAGYKTGLVVTTSVTDATPASFAAHANYRQEEDLIAQQEVGEHPLGRVVDLILGGGRCHFLPNTTSGSCRGDDRDITKLAQEKYGWNYIDSKQDFDSLEGAVKLPLLGLFADYNFPFELDRRNMDDKYPSLDEMAQTALRALEAATQDSDKGFFLMIEGSRIDHAGHGNDPAAQVNEVLAYDKAFASVVKFLERSNTQGVLVATSDHETGGLSVARHWELVPSGELSPSYPGYHWYPEVLANASSSAEHSARRLRSHISNGGDKLKDFVSEELVQEGLGIMDATDAEIKNALDNPEVSHYIFADMISRRARIGWSTHGHSAVDVNIYGSSGSDPLRGNHENTEVGNFLADYLGLDIDAITDELVKKSSDFSINSMGGAPWTGQIPTEEMLQSMEMTHGMVHEMEP